MPGLIVTLMALMLYVSGPSPSAAANPSRLVFVVKDMDSLAHAPDAVKSSAPVNGAAVLFDLEDVEEYSRQTQAFRLKLGAKSRIAALPWWDWVNKKAAGGRFEIRVDGIDVCEGRLHSLFSSSLPSAGLVVMIPLFIFEDHRTVGIGRSHGPPEDPLAIFGCLEDERLLAVLREAGVLVE